MSNKTKEALRTAFTVAALVFVGCMLIVGAIGVTVYFLMVVGNPLLALIGGLFMFCLLIAFIVFVEVRY